ncbi:SCO family protein [Thermomonas sp.]|uniref:SCO family protein n=1 Tax=Thermomonas sp. TaxID=1971895 RepID=UPI002487566E|nr:SCO family protein [Thermomonas sp.]MDI1253616.1 SCO family protein [Thermomonas sp.]
MSKRALPLLIIAAFAAAGGLWAAQGLFGSHTGGASTSSLPAVSSITLMATPRVLPAFSLQQSDGTALTGEELHGHWTLVFIGFTHCPDVCPTTLAQLAAAQKQWAALPEASRPRVLFVSADPARDTPKITGDYAHAFNADSLAATAPVSELEAFARSLSLVFMKVAGPSGRADDYSIDHSASMVVLDPQARMAGVIVPPFDPKAIAADLIALTKASP